MKVTACVLAEEDIETDDIINDMHLCSDREGTDLIDFSVTEYDITDSK